MPPLRRALGHIAPPTFARGNSFKACEGEKAGGEEGRRKTRWFGDFKASRVNEDETGVNRQNP